MICEDSALFLDFDGTLIELADTPDKVIVPHFLASRLEKLSAQLGGALAIVSGRSINDVDRHLDIRDITIAGEHGAQYRIGNGPVVDLAEVDFNTELHAAETAFAHRRGVLIEQKTFGFAIHYRLAPRMKAAIGAFVQNAVSGRTDIEVVAGKAVFELRAKGVSKAHAIETLMRHKPFAGLCPVFFGDDVTDEDGFKVVNRMSGKSIKVGDGESCAKLRVKSVDAVHRALDNALANGDRQ